MLTETIGAPYGAEIEMRVTLGNVHTQQLTSQVIPVTSMQVDMELLEESAPGTVPAQPVYVVDEDAAVYASGADYPGDTG